MTQRKDDLIPVVPARGASPTFPARQPERTVTEQAVLQHENSTHQFISGTMMDGIVNRRLINVYRSSITESVANLFKRGVDTLGDVMDGGGYARIVSAYLSLGKLINVLRAGVDESVDNLFKRNVNTLDEMLDGSLFKRVKAGAFDGSGNLNIGSGTGVVGYGMDGIPDGVTFPKRPQYTGGDNVIDNANFEASASLINGFPPGWVQRGSATCAYETVSPYSGSRSAKVTVTNPGDGMTTIMKYKVRPGEQWKISAAMQATSGSSAEMLMVFRDQNGASKGTIALSTASTTWVIPGTVGTVPAGSVYGEISLECINAAGSAWFDDLFCARVRSLDDEVADGTSYGRTILSYLSSGKIFKVFRTSTDEPVDNLFKKSTDTLDSVLDSANYQRTSPDERTQITQSPQNLLWGLNTASLVPAGPSYSVTPGSGPPYYGAFYLGASAAGSALTDLGVKVGDVLSASVDFVSHSGGGQCILNIEGWTAGFAGTTFAVSSPAGSAGTRLSTAKFTIPANTVYLKFYVYAPSTAGTQTTARAMLNFGPKCLPFIEPPLRSARDTIDNIPNGSTFAKTRVGALDTNGNIDLAGSAWINKNLDNIADSGLYSRQTVVGGAGIGVDNGNFELTGSLINGAPPGWTVLSPATCSYETTTPNSGNRSLKITATGQYGGVASIKHWKVVPGEQYYVEGYIKSISGDSGNIQFWFADKNGGYAGGVQQGSNSTSWTKISTSGTVPANAVVAHIELTMNGLSGGTGEFDDIYISRIASLDTEVQDGSTYGRPLIARLSGGKPLIDFSEGIHLNKHLGNIPDDATSNRHAVTANQQTGAGYGFSNLDATGVLDGKIIRTRSFSDGSFAYVASTNDGLTANVNSKTQTSVLLNNHFQKSVDTLDSVVDGGTYKRITGVSAGGTITDTSVAKNVGLGLYDNGTKSASFTIDWNNGNIQKVTLGASGLTVTLANPAAGRVYTIIFIQDATGGRGFPTFSPTLSWGDQGQQIFNTAANKKNVISFLYDGANYLACNTGTGF